MNNVNLTPILQAVIGLLAAMVTYWIIPWIRSKTTESQQNIIKAVIRSAVYAAEQIIGSGNGPAKMALVKKWLEDQGIEVDTEEIEAIVYEQLNLFRDIKPPNTEEEKTEE